MNLRLILLLAGFLASIAAGAWIVQTKLAKGKNPVEPAPTVAVENAETKTKPNPADPVFVPRPSLTSPGSVSTPPPSRGRLDTSPPNTPAVAAATTGDTFQAVRYVDPQGRPVSMNEKELSDLKEPPPGAYQSGAVKSYLERLRGTGKYRKVREVGLEPVGTGPDRDLVIEVNPEYLLNYKDTPVTELLDVYSDLKGVNLIRDANITSGTKLTVTSKWPLSEEEAIRLLETTFLLNGFYLIAAEDRSIKVLPKNSDPKQEGIALVRSLDDLIGGEVISSFVLKLKWIDPESAKNILTEAFGNLHSYGRIVPVPSVGELVITENSELIRRMKDLLDVVDRPPEEVKRKFVKLSQANADRVAELILGLLEAREKAAGAGTTASAGGGRAAATPAPPASTAARAGNAPAAAAGTGGGSAKIASGEKDLVLGEVQLIPDIRTNRILVVGSPRNVDYIERLIAEFDIVVELSEPYEQALNYVTASEMLPILADLLQEEEGEGGGAGQGSGQGSATRTAGGQLGAGSPPASTDQGVSGAGELGSLQEPGEQQAASSLIVGKTRLIADNRANAILVIGQPEARDKVKSILDKLDKRPMQVYLSTVIGDLTVSNNDEFAVNILQKYIGGPQTGAASVAGGRNLVSPSAEKISFGTGSANAGEPYKYTEPGTTPLSPNLATLAQMSQVAASALPGMQIATFILGSIDLYIQALTATARFRIASRPSVFTANNKKAVIFNGRKIAVPTSTVTTLGAGGSSQTSTGSQQSNIQYQDVVLKIEVVPLINSAREITLQIIQTNDNIIPGAGTQIGGGVTVPEISTQELTTTVTIPDRATILLGGLITQRDSKTTAGVPFLSSIPLMGNLFKSTADTTDRQELVVMIQPSVVQDIPEMREISKTERDLTGFSSKELSPLSMKVGTKTTAPDIAPLSSPEELPVPPTEQ